MEHNNPPSLPWKKGIHPEYRSFCLEVRVCQDNTGNVFSVHGIQDEEDQNVLQSMPSGGLEQICYGLLCEAIRREAFLEAIVNHNEDSDYVFKYIDGNEEHRHKVESDLSRSIVDMLTKTIIKMAPAAAREILAMMESDPGIQGESESRKSAPRGSESTVSE